MKAEKGDKFITRPGVADPPIIIEIISVTRDSIVFSEPKGLRFYSESIDMLNKLFKKYLPPIPLKIINKRRTSAFKPR